MRKMDKQGLIFDPTDLAGMRRLMDEYGASRTLFAGMNGNGERIRISISGESIVVVTDQSNGWTRRNTYWRDGTREETFDGR